MDLVQYTPMSHANLPKKRLRCKGNVVEYAVKRSRRARRLRLSVYPDGRLVATVPYGTREMIIRQFIREKLPWILSTIRFYRQFRGNVLLRQDSETYNKHKDAARTFIEKRLEFFNEYYGFHYNRVSVKNHKTQWGSCSEKRNLNFNYKLIFLPKRLADYVIVHELAHLHEMNHSRRFWGLIAEVLPDVHKRERDLRSYRIS